MANRLKIGAGLIGTSGKSLVASTDLFIAMHFMNWRLTDRHNMKKAEVHDASGYNDVSCRIGAGLIVGIVVTGTGWSPSSVAAAGNIESGQDN